MNKVSIIIPIYNAEDSLADCLKSVSIQTWNNIEIIIVDDGSEDQSIEICNAFYKTDNRYVLIQQNNEGVSSARNHGLNRATGDYVMFVDDDDRISEDMVEKYLQAALSNNCDVVIGGIDIVSPSDEKCTIYPITKDTIMTGSEFWQTVCDENSGLFGYISNKMYRTSVIKENQVRFNENMYAQEDLDFALRVYEKCRFFGLIRYSGYQYNQKEQRRNVPAKDLLKNQVRILRNAYKEKAPEDSLRMQRGRIQRLLFGIMYSREQWMFLRAIREKKWMDYVLQSADVGIEKRMAMSLYKKHCFKLLEKYFSFRNRVKQFLAGNS